MRLLETISMIMMLILCTSTSKSDLAYGVIRNRSIVFFFSIAVIIDILYYGYFAKDLLVEFIANFIVIITISLIMFYTHSFAGGDCKLIITLAALYPARFYVSYNESNISLFLTIFLAIFAGYCYLLINSLWNISSGKVKFTSKYLSSSILAFTRSYITAILYVSIVNLVVNIFQIYVVPFNIWITRILCFVTAFCVGKFNVLKKTVSIVCATIVLVIGCLMIKEIPLSLNPENYMMVFMLILCQTVIRTTIYDSVSIEQLKKGMILSTVSSMLMQRSITKGLPRVSTEDLKSRLTESEVESIKIWAGATHIESLMIVKKIPFAIFISIGYFGYYAMWRIIWG